MRIQSRIEIDRLDAEREDVLGRRVEEKKKKRKGKEAQAENRKC